MEELTKNFGRPAVSELDDSANLIIYDQASVNAQGSFGDFADAFIWAVLDAGLMLSCIDVAFDMYDQESVKTWTRHCQRKATP